MTARRVLGRVERMVARDIVFSLALFALGCGMLALLGVLALADAAGLAAILPFIALPAALFVASAVLAWRWGLREAEAAAVEEVVHRARTSRRAQERA